MKWFPFALVSLTLLALQSAVAARVSLFGAQPDWLLVAVVFFALQVPARDAVVAAWVIGLGADLMTLERLGLIALTYLAVAVVVVNVREFVFRYSRVTQFLMTLVACLSVRALWLTYHRALYDQAGSVWLDVLCGVLVTSIYTAAWAPLFHSGMLKMGKAFGIAVPRYSYAGLHRMVSSHV